MAVTYSLTSPASQNGYGYVHGNPANYTDPTGMMLDCQGFDKAEYFWGELNCQLHDNLEKVGLDALATGEQMLQEFQEDPLNAIHNFDKGIQYSALNDAAWVGYHVANYGLCVYHTNSTFSDPTNYIDCGGQLVLTVMTDQYRIDRDAYLMEHGLYDEYYEVMDTAWGKAGKWVQQNILQDVYFEIATFGLASWFSYADNLLRYADNGLRYVDNFAIQTDNLARQTDNVVHKTQTKNYIIQRGNSSLPHNIEVPSICVGLYRCTDFARKAPKAIVNAGGDIEQIRIWRVWSEDGGVWMGDVHIGDVDHFFIEYGGKIPGEGVVIDNMSFVVPRSDPFMRTGNPLPFRQYRSLLETDTFWFNYEYKIVSSNSLDHIDLMDGFKDFDVNP